MGREAAGFHAWDTQPFLYLASYTCYVVARDSLNRYLSDDSPTSSDALVDRLINCAKRFSFELNPCVFNYLFDGYVGAKRLPRKMRSISNGMTPDIFVLNNFLSALVMASMIASARQMFDDLGVKNVSYDYGTVNVMICGCPKEGKADEADKYFLEAKGRGIKLNKRVYSAAMSRAACMKLDSSVARGLLNEMKEKGRVPSVGIFMNVICTCVKQKNMIRSLKV